jgi:hypothetical protein
MKARCFTHNIHRKARHAGTAALACCALSLLLASGCALVPPQTGQNGTAENHTDSVDDSRPGTGQDAALIALIAGMQAHETSAIDGMNVESGQPFFAASGRPCKYITLSEQNNPGKTGTRLACQDSGGWFFAPDIFTSAARSD